MRKQTRHYSSVKEDEMLEFSELESDEDEPSKPSSKPRRPQEKAQGYPRSECFRVEKNLLVYGSVAYCILLNFFCLIVFACCYWFHIFCFSRKFILLTGGVSFKFITVLAHTHSMYTTCFSFIYLFILNCAFFLNHDFKKKNHDFNLHAHFFCTEIFR